MFCAETDSNNAAHFAVVKNYDPEKTKSLIYIDPNQHYRNPQYVAVNFVDNTLCLSFVINAKQHINTTNKTQ